ncbi:MAG: glycosyltransferase [Phycisphaerae bacterium]
MRICHVITRLIVGGAQENTVLTCAGLAERGHQVTLVAGPETGPEGSLWQQAQRSGAELVRVDSLRRAIKPFSDIKCLGALRRIFKEGGFDVVHTHSSKAGILGRRAAAGIGVGAVIHTIHGMSFNRTQPRAVQWLYRGLERNVARRTDAFVTVADAMIEQAVAAGLGPREKFTTVYSGMPTERYKREAWRRAAVRERWGVTDADVVVGTVARLFRNKGYEEVIEAMAPAVALVPSLKFVWVGGGADRARFVRRVRALGLGDRLHLTGLVPPEDIAELVGGFDMLVHASRWEGLPRAVVQGLLMEVPGIAFDVDGAPEVVEDGITGRLVPYGDTRTLAAAIVELARSADLRERLGREGRRRCVDRFAAQRMVDDLERLYLRLLEPDG